MESSSTGGLRAETEIDAAITAREGDAEPLEGLPLDLRRRRNELQPACRLPNELLGEIFQHAVETIGFFLAEPAYRWPRPWLTVTHVCERWRQVAIGHHALWTRIRFAKSPQLATMFAARADPCALQIMGVDDHCYVSAGWHQFIPPFIASHARNISSLEGLQLTKFVSTSIHTLLGPEFRYKALESLHFMVNESPADVMLIFPPNALPHLRKLSCSGVPQSFIEMLPSLKLTTLQIVRPVAKLPAGSWITILQCLGALETLTLFDTFRVFSSLADLPAIDTSALAYLPHLKVISLEEPDSGFTLSQVFKHLVFPASTKVTLDICDYPLPDALEFLMLTLADVASGNAPNKITMPPFLSFSIDGQGVQLWTANMPVVERSSMTVYGPFNCDWRVNASGLSEHSLRTILATFSFCPLRALALDLEIFSPAAGVFTEFAHLPSIRELLIRGRQAVEAFIELHDRAWPDTTPLLPNLEVLAVANVSWIQHTAPHLRAAEVPHDLARRFEESLRSRKTRFGALKRLRFVGSSELRGWDFGGLVEQQAVETVENDERGWGPEYTCECSDCQIYMYEHWRLEEDEDEDEEQMEAA